jgi:ethanolamine utilization protein EutN
VYLAHVIGTVVCERKIEAMKGIKLLLVQPCDAQLVAVGEPVVAADATQAGEGDLVTCATSREASLAFSPSFLPVDAAIIGIVDAAP